MAAKASRGVLAVEGRQDVTLIKAVVPAFRWRRMLETGRFATISEFAGTEKINASSVSHLLRLPLWAPEVVKRILDGRQPEGMMLPGVIQAVPVESSRQGVVREWSSSLFAAA